MAKEYVKFETPADIQKKTLDLLSDVKTANGILRKGTNECTKAIERGEAALVVIAEDVDPAEIVMHLPQICSEKKVPYVYIKEKVSLGKAAGLNVGSAAIAIQKAGNSSNEAAMKDIIAKMAGKFAFKTEEKKAEAKEEKKPVAAAPKKKAEKKPEEKKAKEEKKPEENKEEEKKE
ncbi:MAG: 50S ribosomal protein L7Ae [Candidatus Micrarchaeota archaeon]